MQKSSQFPATPGPKAQQDAKAKLEEFLLGNKGAAREMMQRHSRLMLGNTPAVINMIKLFYLIFFALDSCHSCDLD